MTDWMPIETAPKNPTDYILACNTIMPFVVYWTGDYWRLYGTYDITGKVSGLTHWMPLLQPPKTD